MSILISELEITLPNLPAEKERRELVLV